MRAPEIDDLIASVLRGERPPWPATLDGRVALFVQRCEYQGVTMLVNEEARTLPAWPPAARAALQSLAVARALWEARHRRFIGDAVAALQRNGIEPIVFKGTALAYTLYQDPACRARGDTDIIVDLEHAESSSQILEEIGFRRGSGTTGDLVSYQASFIRNGGDNAGHAIDLHRKINNSELLSGLFSYAELRGRARRCDALAPGAAIAGPVDALLLACLHRATHRNNPYIVDGVEHYGGDRLIWFYDIHLLASAFSAADWNSFVELAQAKGLCAIAREGLDGAVARFGTTYPALVREALDRGGETVAQYLGAGRVGQMWMDFRAIPGAAARLQFASELVFPSADYMRGKYAGTRFSWLPWLYLRRAAEGVAKRVGRGHPSA